jgi:HEAT repeat protein
LNKGLDELLKSLRPPIDPDLIKKLLSDKRMHISAAYAAIPKEKRELYIGQVQSKLHSAGSDEEQRAALSCLATLRHPSSGYTLMAKAQTSSLTVRCHAIFLMGESKSKEFVSILSGLMSDRNSTVRAAARAAFAKITGARP